MILLAVFAFLGGVVTILSPCILPILPIVLSSSLVGGKKRPLGVVFGFILSFTFFTLFLTSIVKAIGIPPDTLRNFSVVILFVFGLSLLLPKIQTLIEQSFAKLSRFGPKGSSREGFGGGFLIGLSIGLLWTPCVGPILASIISLAITGTVSGQAALITLSYSIGTAIPMLAIVYGGRNLLNNVPWLVRNTAQIQKAFGVLMILTALGIFFNFDRKFQTYILEKFPNYGVGLTKFEDNQVVKDALESLRGGEKIDKDDMGKPMFDLLDRPGVSAPELIQGGQWFNSKPLTLQELKGKVVLVDFWTYTCINCIRTLPYLKNWHDRYKDKGLVIIGVHTPEFEFEKSPENVKKAIEDFGLLYPVMQDNNYATWRAYKNRYWPAKYLVDKKGKIRYTHFGEGAYDETEKAIQALLSEDGEEVSEAVSNPTYQVTTRTPELYLGYERMGYFSTPDALVRDKKTTYKLPSELALHHFALSGEWEIGRERAMPFKGASLVVGFEAKEVFLVMRTKLNASAKIRVFLDGKVIQKEVEGEDVKEGIVEVISDRLYRLVNLDKASQHTLKLEFLNSNIELYAFTFG